MNRRPLYIEATAELGESGSSRGCRRCSWLADACSAIAPPAHGGLGGRAAVPVRKSEEPLVDEGRSSTMASLQAIMPFVEEVSSSEGSSLEVEGLSASGSAYRWFRVWRALENYRSSSYARNLAGRPCWLPVEQGVQ